MKELISVKAFSPEELRKWQLKLLEILVYFRDFCEEHQLRFTLAAGTLLGAVRHNGFIPWDDDLDVQMPRKDYEILIELWNKDADLSKFRCERTDINKCVKFPMTVARSMDTTCIYDHSVNEDICQGLKIDIEFLDGVPAGRFSRFINVIYAKLIALLRAGRIPNRKSKAVKLMSKLILVVLPSNKVRWRISRLLEKRLMKYDFDGEYEYVRYLGTPMRKKSSYDGVVYVDFEGYRMPIPKGYDEILKAYYGDYMQLPSKDKRKPAIDNIVFYDLDHSYLNYKGMYYCTRE